MIRKQFSLITKSLKIIVGIVFLFYLVALQSTLCPAQDSAKVEIRALKTTQIPDYGKKTRLLINQAQELHNWEEELDKISYDSDEMHIWLSDKLDILNDSSKTFHRDFLNRAERELILLNEQLDQQKKTIEDIDYKRIEKTIAVDSMVTVWGLTLDSINSSINLKNLDTVNYSNLNNIKSDIEVFISELQSMKQLLEVQFIKISTIQTQLAVAENKIGNISNAIDNKKDPLSKNILVPDSAPIWLVKSDTSGMEKERELISVIKSRWNIILVFSRNHPEFPIYMLLYFGLILGTIVYLRVNAKKLYADYGEELKETRIVMENPFISSLMIAWFGSLIFTYLPNELDDLIAALMLIPLVIIVKKINPAWKLRTLVLFSMSYLLFLFIYKIEYTYLLQRISLLLFNLLALIALFYFRKNEEMVNRLNKFYFGTLPFVLRFSITLSIISLFANIFGSVQLAKLLLYVVLGIIIAINVLRAAVLLSRSFVFLILMGPLIRHSYILQQESNVILDKMNKAFRFFGYVSFIVIVLELFHIRGELLDAIMSFINYRIVIGDLVFSIGNVLAFFLMIFISSWLSTFIRYILEKEIFPRTKLNTGVSNTISLMIKFTFIVLGVLMAFAAAGIELDKLAIAFGALGVGIGFGLQNIVNNFVSGIVLAMERPMTIGDLVDIPGASGVVKDIGLRASSIRTWDGSDVIVPNGELISNKLTNWTHFDRHRRVLVEVRLPYDTDMEAVSKLLLETASTIPEVMKKPAPYLNFEGIGSSAMEINLYCWINDSDKIFGYGTTIRKTIYKTLLDKGYDIPVPKQDLIINSDIELEKTHQ